MASSSFLSSNFTNLLDIKACKRSQSSVFRPLCGISKHEVGRSLGSSQYLIRTTSFKTAPIHKGSNKDFAIRSSSPLEAGGLFPFWPPTDSSWTTWLVGLVATIPIIVQRLLTLTKEVETVAETAEKVADSVENVAEDVEKLAEDVAEKLPEGSQLKNFVVFVENAAKETAKDAQLAQDFLDKVEEVDQQVQSIITIGSKATVKAARNYQD
ncbi:hypothetical protein ACH5RR_026941 [Cinchona calisaya]|uniref:Uncharacterized protein n=1 Tax=Cinchona calisaya TaxID=153742 RepID=A0ABD2Z5Z2_9GENT